MSNHVFFNIGSSTLKYGFCGQSQHEIPHMLSFKKPNSYTDASLSQEISATQNDEIKFIRGDFLRQRGKLKLEKENFSSREQLRNTIKKTDGIYFEKISLKRRQFIRDQNGIVNNFSINRNFLIGEFNATYNHAFYPFVQGRLNVEHTSNDIRIVQDYIHTIWQFVLTYKLQLTPPFSYYNMLLIVPDVFTRLEIRVVLDILLRQIGFNKIFIINETMAASYAHKLMNCCVIDLGHTKTSVSIMYQGQLDGNSNITLPYGGKDVTRTLYQSLKLSAFPLKFLLNRPYENDILNRLKERFCYFPEIMHYVPPPKKKRKKKVKKNAVKEEDSKAKRIRGRPRKNTNNLNEENGNSLKFPVEVFTNISFLHSGWKYQFIFGDPLIIAPMAYFNPRAFHPYNNNYRTTRNMNMYERIDDSEIENQSFWTHVMQRDMTELKQVLEMDKITESKRRGRKSKKNKKKKRDKFAMFGDVDDVTNEQLKPYMNDTFFTTHKKKKKNLITLVYKKDVEKKVDLDVKMKEKESSFSIPLGNFLPFNTTTSTGNFNSNTNVNFNVTVDEDIDMDKNNDNKINNNVNIFDGNINSKEDTNINIVKEIINIQDKEKEKEKEKEKIVLLNKNNNNNEDDNNVKEKKKKKSIQDKDVDFIPDEMEMNNEIFLKKKDGPLTLTEAIFQSITTSDYEYAQTSKRRRKDTKVTFDIVLGGGGANMSGIRETLEKEICDIFMKKMKTNVQPIFYPSRFDDTGRQFVYSYFAKDFEKILKGLRTSWINLEEYKIKGMKYAREKIPWKLDF